VAFADGHFHGYVLHANPSSMEGSASRVADMGLTILL
jgi:hypothetical protein